MNGTTQADRPPLVKIVGTVADITLASAHNKPGKIELESGKILYAFPDKLQMIKKGETYDFGCETTEFRGVLNHTVRAARAAGGSDKLGPAPSNFVTTEEVLAQRRPQPQRAIDAQAVLLNSGQSARQEPRGDFTEFREPAQTKAPLQSQNYYKPTNPRDAKRMALCSWINAFIQTGRVERSKEAVVETILMLSDAYDETIGQDDA